MNRRILVMHPHPLLRRGFRTIWIKDSAPREIDDVATVKQMMLQLNLLQYTHLIIGFNQDDQHVAETLATIASLFSDLKVLFLSDKNLDDLDSNLAKWKINYHIPSSATEEESVEELQRFLSGI